MSGVNKVILVGNLGQDPDVRTMPNGNKVANFSVATAERWNDRDGNRQERTEWHRVAIFGKIAEVAEKYLHKGSKVYIEGRMQTRKYTDNSGVEKSSTEVVISGFNGSMVMLDSAGGGGGGGRSQGSQGSQGSSGGDYSYSSSSTNDSHGDDFSDESQGGLDDDIPF